MRRGLVWTTAEDMARNSGCVLSLYRQLLRSINSPNLPLNLAARLAKKAEVHAIFTLASEERSLHNINDLIDAANYSLSLLRKGEIPKLSAVNEPSYFEGHVVFFGYCCSCKVVNLPNGFAV